MLSHNRLAWSFYNHPVRHIHSIKPYAPPTGATVGLVTPSSPINDFPRRTARAIAALEGCGFNTVLAPNALWRHSSRPSPKSLASDLNWCFENPSIDIVMGTTGGNTAREILPHLDYESAARSRKVFCGFSDLTTIVLALHAKTGLVTFHGPSLLPSFGDADGIHPYAAEGFKRSLSATGHPGRVEPPATYSTHSPFWDKEDDVPRDFSRASRWRGLVSGVAHGRLMGGHLETVRSAIDTEYFPSVDSSVLFLETNCHTFDFIERDLRRLSDAGVFDRASGLVFGRLVSEGYREHVCDVIIELGEKHALPVLIDVDIGHTVPILTLPVGIDATVNADAGTLTINENAVAERDQT